MPVEEQLLGSYVVSFYGGAGWNRVGQYMQIAGRYVSELWFKTKRVGSPNGTLTFAIRKHSDDSVLNSKVYGSTMLVPTDATWIGVTFDTPVLINDYVKICMEWGGSLGDGSNYLEFWASTSNPKAGEYVARYSTSWSYTTTWDATYYYVYLDLPVPVTDDPDTIEVSTADLNGTLDDDGGESCDCGFEWGETVAYGNTTPTQSRTIGQTFEQTISGLSANTVYHYRAVATNGAGTANGDDKTFTTQPATTKATEKQVLGAYIIDFFGGAGWYRVGQRLTIPGRSVCTLYFKTKRIGSPTGTLTFAIRKVSDDSVITSKSWGSTGDVPDYVSWISATFDTPAFINEEVRICMEWGGDVGDDSNCLEFWATSSSVKADEKASRYSDSWGDVNDWDATYIYEYVIPKAGLNPAVLELL